MSAPDPIRIGILGAANIAPKALIDPARKLDSVVVSRVAARDPERARTFAMEHGVSGVEADYQALITSDAVDVVYNPLPMSEHAQWTIAALGGGKDVFCEKPFAANASEARAMVDAAEESGRILVEAFHYRYHPLFLRILDLVRSGTIGEIQRVEGRFAVPIVAEGNIRYSWELAGGSLMDLGCYPTSWVRHIVGEEPEVVSASAIEGPPHIDISMDAELRFPSGTTGHVHCSMDPACSRDIQLTVEGTSGRIEAINPMAPQMGNRLTITTARGTTAGPVEGGVSYEHQLRAFVDHLRHGTPFPTQGADSIGNMTAIDAMYRAAGLPVRGTVL
ncbi:MAG: Gfo/Idh/MocA family oxidoreductase [Actinomycetia bacterium]|nr:Gfo/Idh/MocA family oxidoreductase [Actinomycetes bacterium]